MKKNYYVCILLHSEDQLILGHLKKGNSEFYEISKITNRKKKLSYNFIIALYHILLKKIL